MLLIFIIGAIYSALGIVHIVSFFDHIYVEYCLGVPGLFHRWLDGENKHSVKNVKLLMLIFLPFSIIGVIIFIICKMLHGFYNIYF